MREFRFGAIDTDDFARLCERELPGALAAVDGRAWLDGDGVPANAPTLRARKLEAVEAAAAAAGGVPEAAATAEWGPTEWELYLERCRGRSPRAPRSTRGFS